MTFGQIIKDLRRKADMTQEGLAEALGITGQAVSRWENDLAMPDISLLPVLANLFDVTTDYLLGVDITQKESRIDDILRQAHQKGLCAQHAEAAEIVRAGLKEYPRSYRLMYGLLFHLGFIGNIQADKDDRNRIFGEAVEIGEKILSECTDNTIRHNTVGELCLCYAQLGESEKMRQLAETMPDIWHTRECLLAIHTRGDEQLTAKRQEICRLLGAAVISLSQLHYRHDTRGVWAGMPPEEILTAERNALTITDILCPDGDYGSLDFTRIHAFYTMADVYFEAGEWEEGLAHLEKAIDIAVYLDTDYDGNRKHTSPLFCGQPYGFYIANKPEGFSDSLLHLLKIRSYFTDLTTTEKGRELIARLEAQA